jgi:hypothetical protein
MLNIPALNATATARPEKMSGVAFSSTRATSWNRAVEKSITIPYTRSGLSPYAAMIAPPAIPANAKAATMPRTCPVTASTHGARALSAIRSPSRR